MRLDRDFDFEFLLFYFPSKSSERSLVMGAFGKGTTSKFDTIPI